MAFLEKLLASIVGSLIMFGLIGALLWFGAPKLWSHVIEAEMALRDRPALLATIERDRLDANAASTRCDARVASSIKAAGTISRLSAPRAAEKTGAQPALTADDIRGLIQ